MSEASGNGGRPTLPEGWEWKTMGEIARVVGGSTPKSKEPNYWGGDIPWLAVSDLTGYTEQKITRGARTITQAGYEACATQMVPANTVLFSSRAPIGYVAIAEQSVCTSQGFKSFVLQPGVDPRYVYWWLKAAKPIAEAMASGTTFKELSGKRAAEIPIPVAPFEEQVKIARALEQLMNEVDEGRQDLERAAAGARAYRAACLEAVFDGGLAPEGKFGAAALVDLADVQSGIAKGRPAEGADVELPYIRTANVQAGYLDLSEMKTIAVSKKQRLRHRLQRDDVLVLEGGDADKVGRGWIWNAEIAECLHQNHVFAVRPNRARLLPGFLAYYINSPTARRYFLSVANQTTNLASINKGNLKALPVPLPAIPLQEEIVVTLDRQVAGVDALESDLEARRGEITHLRSAVFANAFTGTLRRSRATLT